MPLKHGRTPANQILKLTAARRLGFARRLASVGGPPQVTFGVRRPKNFSSLRLGGSSGVAGQPWQEAIEAINRRATLRKSPTSGSCGPRSSTSRLSPLVWQFISLGRSDSYLLGLARRSAPPP